MSAPSEELDFDQGWEIFIERGFLRSCSDDQNAQSNPQIVWSTTDDDVYEEETANASLAVATDIYSVLKDPISLVEKIRTKLRIQIEKQLQKRILPKMNAVQKEQSLLKVLYNEWIKYKTFRDWINGIFSEVNERLVLEEDAFRTKEMANQCFGEIIFKPFQPRIFDAIIRKFDVYSNDTDLISIAPDVLFLQSISNLMNEISYREGDYYKDFSRWLVMQRRPLYHQLARTSLDSDVTLEEFSEYIMQRSRRERIACNAFFDAEVEDCLYAEVNRVFFGIYAHKGFRKDKEQYKMWVKEEKCSSLERVNKIIATEGKIAKEAMEMFRVSFVEKICSALDIDCAPFLTDADGFKSPFHICCHNSQSGHIFEELGENASCMIKIMDTLLKSFKSHAGMVEAFSATKDLKSSSTRIIQTHLTQCKNCALPSMLTSFCRYVLSKYGISGTGMNPQIRSCHECVLFFLRFFHEPDAFEKVYVDDFYNRLMENELYSVHSEHMIISAFAGSDNHGCVSRGRRMLRNHVESQKLFNLFSSSPFGVALQEENHVRMKLRVNLFRWGTLDPIQRSPISIPDEIRICHQSYASFFRSHHDDSNLDWDFRRGTVTLQTNLFCHGPREWIELELNVEQYSILNMFQNRDSISLGEIMERVITVTSDSFDWEETVNFLKSIIHSMSSPFCPLLKKDPATSAFITADKVTLNTHFTSTRANIKVPEPQYDRKLKVCAAQEKPDNKQILSIESAIVRVMKDVRRASREKLLDLVSKNVAAFLELNATSFDDCLQRLTARDYITSEDGFETFTYVL